MKGILMTPDNTKTIVDLRKTVTRRVINPQPFKAAWNATAEHPSYGWFWRKLYQTWEGEEDFFKRLAKSARYQIGEVVYIKEAWGINPKDRDRRPIPQDEIVEVRYLSGNTVEKRWGDIYCNDSGVWLSSVTKAYTTGKWQSPMFLPVKLARYFIKITDVSAGRTKDITPEDCHAEGIWLPPERVGYFGELYKEAYFALYDSINGKGSHEKNWDFRYAFDYTGREK